MLFRSGLFLYATNQMSTLFFSISSAMLPCTSSSLFVLSNVTTVENLTILETELSSSNTAYFSVFLVLIPHLKTGRQSVPFAPLTIFFVLSSFKPQCLPNFGQKPFTPLPSCLTFVLPKQIQIPHPTSPFSLSS